MPPDECSKTQPGHLLTKTEDGHIAANKAHSGNLNLG